MQKTNNGKTKTKLDIYMEYYTKWNKRAFKQFINAFSGAPLSEKHELIDIIRARVHGNASYYAPKTINYDNVFTRNLLDKRRKHHGLMIQKLDTLLSLLGASDFTCEYLVKQRGSVFRVGKNNFTPCVLLMKIGVLDDNGNLLYLGKKKYMHVYITVKYEVSK